MDPEFPQPSEKEINPQNSTDPLDDEIRAHFSKEWDEISGRPDDPKKAEFVEKKTNEIFDTADIIGRVEDRGRIDPLTKLPNRKDWNQGLERAIALSERANVDVAILGLDLDNFKRVNDTYGHKIGDDVLKAVAEVLHNLRGTDMAARIARLGGEELGVLLVNAKPSSEQPNIQRLDPVKLANELRQRIHANVAAKTEIKDQTVSIGLTRIPPPDSTTHRVSMTPEQLQEQADIALYHSKENGRNRVTEFKPGMKMPPKGKK